MDDIYFEAMSTPPVERQVALEEARGRVRWFVACRTVKLRVAARHMILQLTCLGWWACQS